MCASQFKKQKTKKKERTSLFSCFERVGGLFVSTAIVKEGIWHKIFNVLVPGFSCNILNPVKVLIKRRQPSLYSDGA